MTTIRVCVWGWSRGQEDIGRTLVQFRAVGPAEVLGPGDPSGVFDVRLADDQANQFKTGDMYDISFSPAQPDPPAS